jgi:hypothetical protein
MNRKSKNWNCDGDLCTSPSGEVRRLPLGGNSAVIVCKACYFHEINYRRERNEELSGSARFDLPRWDSLEVYKGEE